MNKLVKDTKRIYCKGTLNDVKINPTNMWDIINKLSQDSYDHKANHIKRNFSLKIQLRYHILLIRISIQLEKN